MRRTHHETIVQGRRRWLLWALAAVACTATARAQDDAEPLTFAITYDASIAESFTGRVYVMLSTSDRREPRLGPNWFNTQPFFAMDVEHWSPGEVLHVGSGDEVDAYPVSLHELSKQTYAIQAVMRRNADSPTIGTGAGTAYSPVITRSLDGGTTGEVALHITEVVAERSPTDNRTVKAMIDSGRLAHVRVRSAMLSAFHGRDIYHEAAVVLPDGYNDDADADRRYPALYMISGFGGDEFQALFMAMRGDSDAADDIIKIGLDPLMRTGHHVFADSANNGPVGTALVEELIPHLEKQFRLVSAPHGRYLTGISSGGWSSLWLQISHPSFFGGVWSFVPDPVDFRRFQTVDIYADGANMYVDDAGEPRPLARNGGQVLLLARDFAAMEVVIDEGGQLHSFEAVFSPKGADGRPMPLYDRDSGAIDPYVAEAWKQYDINLVVQKRWPEIGRQLAGKLRIIAGEDDNFYLEDAVKLLAETLKELGSDAEVTVLEGRDHGTAPSPEQFQKLDVELLEAFRRGEK